MTIKALKWPMLVLAVLISTAVVGLFFINRHLAGYIESKLNQNVEDYRFTVGEAKLSPNMTLEIRKFTVIQTDHPDPPVAEIPLWKLGIQWRHIFSGVLVSDYLIDRPVLHIRLPNVKKEARDYGKASNNNNKESEKERAPLHKKGWREAIYTFYPFKINRFSVVDADFTYVDQDSSRPIHLTDLNFSVANIRNIRFPNDSYPSDFKLEGNVFGSGRIQMNGRANFLSEPNVGINVHMALMHVALEPFLPVVQRYNFQVQGGVVSAEGHLEYTAEGQTNANLKSLTVENAKIDFVHTPQTKAKEKRMGKTTVRAAKKLQNNNQETVVQIENAEIKKTEFGFVNKEAKPPYRVFLSNSDVKLSNISNHPSKGIGSIDITGKFMGSGTAEVGGKFRPETKSPDFSLNAKIEKTKMRTLNDLFRAYGNFDVASGMFSLYSELIVRDGRVSGYIKPFFKDMEVYDSRQDKDENLFHKLYEGVVGGVTKLLENPSREELATKTEIEGKIEKPEADTWGTVVNLIRNAFFKAILPGFEKEALKKK
jgi:hypothetical protein